MAKSTKKSEALESPSVEQEFKPFSQTPIWNADANLTVKGNEFEAIYNLFNLFMPGVNALQAVFERGIQAGVIEIKHEYTDGSGEVPKEELDRYFKRFNELMQQELEKAKSN